MSSTKITVPDFHFSGVYYAEILRRLRIFNRQNAPEITSEAAEEPFIQLERAFALVGHLNNVYLDLAANELLLPTCKLRDSARDLLALIDYELKDYAPATVDLLIELPQALTSSVEILGENARFETRREDGGEAISYEVANATTLGPSNVLDAAFSIALDRGGSDLRTVIGDADAIESATLNATSADIGKEVEISGSILGNNGVFRLAEVLQTGATSRVRLEATLGGPAPLFIYEVGLTWTLRAWSSNHAVDVNGAGTWKPWTGVTSGDKLYLGSKYALWDELEVTLATPGANLGGVWEYYDPDAENERPESVTNNGGNLTFDVDPILDPDGTGADRSGALVRVTYLPTGASELVVSAYAGGNVATTSAFLGQSGTASVDPGDYAIGCNWLPIPGAADGTANFSQDGKVDGYVVPQTLRANWRRVTVEEIEGYYMRFRVLSAVGASDPTLDRCKIDGGTQYVVLSAVQGETVGSEPRVSSTGLAGQTFELSTTPGLRNSVRVFVDEGGGEVEWTNFSNAGKRLVSANGKERAFEVAQDAAGLLSVKFGDGTHGRIPPLGVDNLRFVYRVRASANGNVGAGTVTVNSEGSAFVKSVTNPRDAGGWRVAEGSTPASLARVKELAPASLWTGNRAVAPEDYANLAVAFETSSGARPVVRARAVEEGFGPKTIKLVVVGTNGVAIDSNSKEELELYFNGDANAGVAGVGAANVEVTVVNFSPRVVPVSLSIIANAGLSESAVRTMLGTFVNPTATENGATFVWHFGGRVPTSRIAAEVFALAPGSVFDVDVGLPSSDLELMEDELPLLDSSAVSVSIVAPRV